jgi:hypothetical protein
MLERIVDPAAAPELVAEAFHRTLRMVPLSAPMVTTVPPDIRSSLAKR